MNRYPKHIYHGFDFYEMQETFNLPEWDIMMSDRMKPHYCGEYDSMVLKCYLNSVMAHSNWHFGGKDFVMRFAAKQIRLFLKEMHEDALVSGHENEAPIYKTFAELEDDYTLLRWFGDNCEKCWT